MVEIALQRYAISASFTFEIRFFFDFRVHFFFFSTSSFLGDVHLFQSTQRIRSLHGTDQELDLWYGKLYLRKKMLFKKENGKFGKTIKLKIVGI